MTLFKKSLSGILLGMCSFTFTCTMTPDTKRAEMFRERIGLPEDFDRENFESEFEKKYYLNRMQAYSYICFHGESYDKNSFNARYINEEEHEKLLVLYGWKKNKKQSINLEIAENK